MEFTYISDRHFNADRFFLMSQSDRARCKLQNERSLNKQQEDNAFLQGDCLNG